jgi:hypothetical protein
MGDHHRAMYQNMKDWLALVIKKHGGEIEIGELEMQGLGRYEIDLTTTESGKKLTLVECPKEV